MSNWSKFEEECFDYLVDEYQSEKVRFFSAGKSDSKAPDIKVYINDSHEFNIEVKMESAQSGQFVLHPDEVNERFIYSTKNNYPENEFSKIIKEYMNRDFIDFKNAGSSGKKIDIDDKIFYEWIKKYYKDDNVEFFISKYKDKKIIIPVDKLENYFTVSAVYRMKKSGSSSPSKSNVEEIEELLSLKDRNIKVFIDNNKMFFNTNMQLDGVVLEGRTYRYLIRKVKENLFTIRRLSNTENSNVIFSIRACSHQNPIDIILFKKRLNLN